MKHEIREISELLNIPVSTVEYTISAKGLKVRYNEAGRKVIDLESFKQARVGMKKGRKKVVSAKLFEFDFDELQKRIFEKGLSMTEFFRYAEIKRNRYYSIKSGAVYPTQAEIGALNVEIR
jgi:hypothetical protein